MNGMAGILFRQIPAELIAGVQAGDLQVLGSVIRSVSSGRIVGHLQETSALGQLMRLPGFPASLVGDAITIFQNEQIKAALDVIQSLQITNTAISAAFRSASLLLAPECFYKSCTPWRAKSTHLDLSSIIYATKSAL